MGQVVIVGIFLIGLCAFVWSLIAEEAAGHAVDTRGQPHGADSSSRPRPRSPRIRFVESLDVTMPTSAGRPHALPGIAAPDRGGRLVAALELILLIVLVGGIVAAVVLGAGHVLVKGVSGHLSG
jgi:hypothetical protein